MSQHDMIIADATGSAFLADLNLCVKALAENNYGTTEPAVMYAHMWWADTTADVLKKRNAANTGWISYMTLSTGALLGQGLGTPASGVLTNCTGTAAGLSIGGNASTATDFATAGTFTGTLTGFDVDKTADVDYFVNNGVVTLSFPNGIGGITSNSTSMTLTGLPETLWPSASDSRSYVLVSDTVIQLAYASISASTGVITFSKSDGSLFNTGVSKQIRKGMMQYPI